ncbi:MAG: flavodoxin family protein [Clostridiales bacterium]|nr:flavodoxin family protein [Clostridiales bacterium]
MKTAIIYYSKHHGNTKKLLDAISAEHKVTFIDATQTQDCDLTNYDMIGFASGIYYSKFHKSVLQFAEKNLPHNKSVFFIYTYGAEKDGYTRAIESVVLKKSANIKGAFGCFGFNTFGPFKLIGGMAKGHPDKNDVDNAVCFFNSLVSQ